MDRLDKDSILNGPVVATLIRFSLPIAMASLITNGCQMVDTLVLAGQGDSAAVAGASAVGMITAMIANSLIGLANGATILLAQAIGARAYDRIKTTVSTAFLLVFALSLLCLGIGIPLSPVLPAMVACPSGCYTEATTYLMMYICATPAILIYNFGSAVIRAGGDSVRPMLHIGIASVLHVILAPTLCTFVSDRVLAVSLSRIVSWSVCAALAMVRMHRMGDAYRISFSAQTIHFATLYRILAIGLPCAFTSAVFQIGNLPVARTLNAFGEDVIAGSNASINVETNIALIGTSLAAGVLTIVAQNYGAQRPDRVRKALLCGALLAAAVEFALSMVALIFRYPIASIFLPQGEGYATAIEAATFRMLCVLSLAVLDGAKNVFLSGIQGLGHTLPPTIINIVTVLLFRAAWIYFVFPHFQTYRTLFLCFPVSWLLTFALSSLTLLYYYRKQLSRKSCATLAQNAKPEA